MLLDLIQDRKTLQISYWGEGGKTFIDTVEIKDEDFFEYASTLLDKYKYDESVRAIGSMNVDTQKWGDASYYFSMMNRNLCAWATWRRAWQAFDLRLMNISKINNEQKTPWEDTFRRSFSYSKRVKYCQELSIFFKRY